MENYLEMKKKDNSLDIGAYFEMKHKKSQELLGNIKKDLPNLKKLYDKYNGHWSYEDPIYRYYHGSYKVRFAYDSAYEIIEKLKSLAPEGIKFSKTFEQIELDATRKARTAKTQDKTDRAKVELFFHARFFLEMAIKYGEELNEDPKALPSGYAALLYFYNLR